MFFEGFWSPFGDPFGHLFGTFGQLFLFEERLCYFFCVFFGASKKGAKKLPKVLQKGYFFEVLDMAQV